VTLPWIAAIALVPLAVIWTLVVVVVSFKEGAVKLWAPLRSTVGLDRSPSTSRFQFLLWAIVVMYGFLVVFIGRVLLSKQPVNEISVPPNLLLVLGYSVAGAAGAAGIVAAKVQGGTLTPPPEPDTSPAALVQTGDGNTDLGKVQLLAWNLVAMGVFLFLLFTKVTPNDAQLPDLPAVLMVLAGVSQAAYLGNKLVTTTTPRFFGAQPPERTVGEPIVVSGAALGATSNGSVLTVDDSVVPTSDVDWRDTQLSFPLGERSDGRPWDGTRPLAIRAVIGGQPALGDASVRVAKPAVAAVTNGQVNSGKQSFTITGTGFGPQAYAAPPGRPDLAGRVFLVADPGRGGAGVPIPSSWIQHWDANAITFVNDAHPVNPGDLTTPELGCITRDTDYRMVVSAFGVRSDPSAETIRLTW
jgi:hypothetical protein